jgi:hypothetical protein
MKKIILIFVAIFTIATGLTQINLAKAQNTESFFARDWDIHIALHKGNVDSIVASNNFLKHDSRDTNLHKILYNYPQATVKTYSRPSLSSRVKTEVIHIIYIDNSINFILNKKLVGNELSNEICLSGYCLGDQYSSMSVRYVSDRRRTKLIGSPLTLNKNYVFFKDGLYSSYIIINKWGKLPFHLGLEEYLANNS